MKKLLAFLKRTPVLLLLIFAVSFGVYMANIRYTGTTDTVTNEIFADNFSKTGKTYLENNFQFNFLVQPEELPQHAKNTKQINGHFYSKYPPATPVLVYPFFKAFHVLHVSNYKLIGKITAAFITAISICFMFLFLKNLTSKKLAFVIAFIYAFGSSTWGITSQALWQHTLGQFFSSIILFLLSLYLVTKDSTERVKLFWKVGIPRGSAQVYAFFIIGVLLGLDIAVRPTNALTALCIGLLILLTRNWKLILATILGGIGPFAMFLYYNYHVFGSITGSGYGAEASAGWNAKFSQGFFGLLFSPSVGLLVFSPIFAFAIAGMIHIVVRALREHRLAFTRYNLYFACVLVFLANLLLYSKWWAWHGDSWVYRMIIEGIPYLAVGFVPAFEWVRNLERKRLLRKILISLALLLAAFSVYVQVLGTFSEDYSWHSRYKVTYYDNDYLFDIPNSQLLYYLKAQRYYIQLPHRTVYVVGDRFGDRISFDGNRSVVDGQNKIIHALALNTGRAPKVEYGELEIYNKYDGMQFFINDPYKAKDIVVKINYDTLKTNKAAKIQVRELLGGKEAEVTKLTTEDDSSTMTLTHGAEEIRIQNDDTPDQVTITSIEFSVK